MYTVETLYADPSNATSTGVVCGHISDTVVVNGTVIRSNHANSIFTV